MNSETILRALSHAEPAYLEHAAETQTRKTRDLRTARRLSSIAAVIVLAMLVVSVSAAVIYGPKIFAQKKSNDSFDLTILGSEAAEDAPGYLAQYYLPTQLPEGSTLDNGTLAWELHLDWTVETGNGSGQITFFQEPLYKDIEEYSFLNMGGLDLDDLTQGTCEIGGVSYWTMSYSSVYGDTAWYYWKDAGSHYLFGAFFSEVIPQADREAFLASVTPVDAERVFAALGIQDVSVWYLGALPDGWQVESYALYAALDSLAGFHTKASDNRGHNTYLENCVQDAFVGYTETDMEIDGVPIRCYAAQTDVEGNLLRQETWCFTAPDGKTRLYLTFYTTDGTQLPEADKLTVFRGIRSVTLQELNISEQNSPK